jgi:hypothetical protein
MNQLNRFGGPSETMKQDLTIQQSMALLESTLEQMYADATRVPSLRLPEAQMARLRTALTLLRGKDQASTGTTAFTRGW